MPLKFAYAGSAAFTHDRYAETDSYAEMMASAAAESDTLLHSGLADLDLNEIAEVGPGNGRHSVAFLGQLAARGRAPRRYLAMDFSQTLLGIAERRVRDGLGPRMRLDTEVWDVEECPTGHLERWRSGGSPVVVCLLGHTLGNLEDPNQALRHLAGGLRAGDVLLASVLLRIPPGSEDSTMTAYRTDAFRSAVLEPLLAAGLDPSDLDLRIGYDDNAVVGEATLCRDARVGGTELPRGHQIRCFLSRRFTGDEVVRLFSDSGWSIRAIRVDETGNHMTVVAARKQGSQCQ
ncbi:L-histidine N(alpha)-methyltransferase [Dactylosporangium sp. CS-047395]|uniref:L-histidine N(alpha)-methyltransferase n=1 Tax=Dactylosporangium sp. CS-047395 TaxID=3239936 RepID=UPI003D8FB9CF